jgi:hypothetical protein
MSGQAVVLILGMTLGTPLLAWALYRDLSWAVQQQESERLQRLFLGRLQTAGVAAALGAAATALSAFGAAAVPAARAMEESMRRVNEALELRRQEFLRRFRSEL